MHPVLCVCGMPKRRKEKITRLMERVQAQWHCLSGSDSSIIIPSASSAITGLEYPSTDLFSLSAASVSSASCVLETLCEGNSCQARYKALLGHWNHQSTHRKGSYCNGQLYMVMIPQNTLITMYGMYLCHCYYEYSGRSILRPPMKSWKCCLILQVILNKGSIIPKKSSDLHPVWHRHE